MCFYKNTTQEKEWILSELWKTAWNCFPCIREVPRIVSTSVDRMRNVIKDAWTAHRSTGRFIWGGCTSTSCHRRIVEEIILNYIRWFLICESQKSSKVVWASTIETNCINMTTSWEIVRKIVWFCIIFSYISSKASSINITLMICCDSTGRIISLKSISTCHTNKSTNILERLYNLRLMGNR